MGRLLSQVKHTQNIWDDLFSDDNSDMIAVAIESLKRLKHSLLMASMLGSCMTAKSSEGRLERINNLKSCSSSANKLTSEKISCLLDILQNDISVRNSVVARDCKFCAIEIEAKMYLAGHKMTGPGLDCLMETSTFLLLDENVWRRKKRYFNKNSLYTRDVSLEERVQIRKDALTTWARPNQEMFCKQTFMQQRNFKRRESSYPPDRSSLISQPHQPYGMPRKRLKVMYATYRGNPEPSSSGTRALTPRPEPQSFWVGRDEPLSTEEEPDGTTEEDRSATMPDPPTLPADVDSPTVKTVICGNQSPNAIINEIRGCLLNNTKP